MIDKSCNNSLGTKYNDIHLKKWVIVIFFTPTNIESAAISNNKTITTQQYSRKLNYHRLKAGGLSRSKAQVLRLKVALGAKAPSFPD